MPTMANVPEAGASATGNGLLTQAPPNTGAGWYTLATGAWPGVHGSTNNTFHINGQPFGNRDRRVRPRRPAGGVDRPVRRARRPEGRPGRVGGRPQRHRSRARPSTSRRSSPAAASPRTSSVTPASPLRRRRRSSPRSASSSTTPAGYAGQAAVPRAPRRRRPPAGPSAAGVATARRKEMRLRVLDFGRRQVRPQRLHLRQHRTTAGRTTTRCCSRATKDARRRRSATSARASGPTSRSRSPGGALDGKTAGMLRQGRGADAATCRRVRLFHTSVSRAIATWPTWPGEPGFTGDFDGVPRPEVPDVDGRRLRRSSRPASTARKRTSSRACTGRPATCRCSSTSSKTYKPDLLLVGVPDDRRVPAPVPRPRLARSCPNGSREPRLRRRRPRTASPDGRVASARGVHPRRAYQEADEILTLAAAS